MAARRVRQNRFDNWYGYEGSRRVRAFGNGQQLTAEQSAAAWASGDDTQGFPATIRTARRRIRPIGRRAQRLADRWVRLRVNS